MLSPGESVFYQVPIAVKPSIQIRVALYGIAFSGNHDFGALLLNLFPCGLTVSWPLSAMIVCAVGTLAIKAGACVQIVNLTFSDLKHDGQPAGVYSQMSLLVLPARLSPIA